MNIFVIVAVACVLLGVLAYIVAQWPDPSTSKKKKKEPLPPVPAPGKDAAAVAERFEKRVRTLDNALVAAQNEQKQKLKEIEDFKASIASLERQVTQERAWREKEEALVVKEKKVEQDLRADLERTRAMLHEESNQRIKLEYEVKELRLAKEGLSADLRKSGGQNHDLDSRVKGFIEETRMLKAENAQLKQKKEADQWVAKDDHLRIERQLVEQLRQAKREVELLKMRLPADLRDVGEKDQQGIKGDRHAI